jgi:drug/metabolite transporter (DMT)-like permease
MTSAAASKHAASGPAVAIGWMSLAVLLLSIMDAMVKWLEGAGYSVAQLVFFRAFFALPLIGIAILRGGGIRLLRTRRPLGHIARALLGTTTVACFFYAFGHMALADAVAIGFAAPLFSTILSVLVLREAVGLHRWSAVVFGFLGVLIMLRPGAGTLQPAALVALAGTVTYSGTTIVIRQLGRTEPALATVFYFMATSMAVGALFLPLNWHAPDLLGWAMLAGLGTIGAAGQFAITQALRIGPIAVVAPFDYTALLWATLFGFVIWHDVPDAPMLLGAAIVIGSGLYILYRETRRSRSK